MFGMIRTLARCLLAAVLIAAHVPLPAAPARGAGPAGVMACCAPKACCDGLHACSMGGHCGVVGASHGAKGSGGAGPQLLAGGCGDETPRVTPLQLDPTVPARVAGWVPFSPAFRTIPASDLSCISLAARPLVPPPRA